MSQRKEYNQTDIVRVRGYNYQSEVVYNYPQIFNKRIWRVRDVAEFLNCSIGHVYNLTSDEKIPKVKKGKFLYFIPEDILNWILEGDLQ